MVYQCLHLFRCDDHPFVMDPGFWKPVTALQPDNNIVGSVEASYGVHPHMSQLIAYSFTQCFMFAFSPALPGILCFQPVVEPDQPR